MLALTLAFEGERRLVDAAEVLDIDNIAALPKHPGFSCSKSLFHHMLYNIKSRQLLHRTIQHSMREKSPNASHFRIRASPNCGWWCGLKEVLYHLCSPSVEIW